MNSTEYLLRLKKMAEDGYSPEFIRLYGPFLNPLYDMFGSFTPSLKECLDGMARLGFWNKFDDDNYKLTFKIEGNRCLLVDVDYSNLDKCTFSFPNIVEWLEQALSEGGLDDAISIYSFSEILNDIKLSNEKNADSACEIKQGRRHAE